MISWSESLDIECAPAAARAAVADQSEVMAWSAWPAATGYSCAVDGDGVSPGSSIVFTAPDGRVMGRQTIVSSDAEVVRNRLENRGPGGRPVRPEVDFRVEELSATACRVWLDFRLSPPVPAVLHPLVRLALSRRIRPLHRDDLENLRRRLERPSRA